MTEQQLLSLLASQGGYALLLALTVLWLGKVAWPTLLRKHEEAMSRLDVHFGELAARLAALERREAQRVRLEWARLFTQSGRTIEDAEREAARILGNGSQ